MRRRRRRPDQVGLTISPYPVGRDQHFHPAPADGGFSARSGRGDARSDEKSRRRDERSASWARDPARHGMRDRVRATGRESRVDRIARTGRAGTGGERARAAVARADRRRRRGGRAPRRDVRGRAGRRLGSPGRISSTATAAASAGSRALEDALRWAVARMRDDGSRRRPARARARPALGARRGARAHREAGRRVRCPCSRLGGSVGTRATLRAPLVVFDDLDALREDDPFARRHDRAREPPHGAVRRGPRRSRLPRGRAGAAACRVGRGAARARAPCSCAPVTATSLATLHAGALDYADRPPEDPGGRGHDRGRRDAGAASRGAVRSRSSSSLGARQLPDAPSANAVGEIRGSEHPEEIVLLGAHMDSWDVGPGASDDAAGCVAVMEAMRLLRASGLVPQRTIRAVLFTAEEYGLAGAKDYHRRHHQERHVAAFETDYGMGAPDAIGVGGGPEALQAMTPFLPAFAPPRHPPLPRSRLRRRRRGDRPRGRRRLQPDPGRASLLRHPPHGGRHARQDPSGGSPTKRRRGGALGWILATR